jgi:hypothetical protein
MFLLIAIILIYASIQNTRYSNARDRLEDIFYDLAASCPTECKERSIRWRRAVDLTYNVSTNAFSGKLPVKLEFEAALQERICKEGITEATLIWVFDYVESSGAHGRQLSQQYRPVLMQQLSGCNGRTERGRRTERSEKGVKAKKTAMSETAGGIKVSGWNGTAG